MIQSSSTVFKVGAANVNKVVFRFTSVVQLRRVYGDVGLYYCDRGSRQLGTAIGHKHRLQEKWRQQECLDILMRILQIRISCMVFAMEIRNMSEQALMPQAGVGNVHDEECVTYIITMPVEAARVTLLLLEFLVVQYGNGIKPFLFAYPQI
jgi:hypothetical protein